MAITGQVPVTGFNSRLGGSLAHNNALASVAGNADKRIAITGPCRAHWRDGVRRLVEVWEPRLREGRSAYAGRAGMHARDDTPRTAATPKATA